MKAILLSLLLVTGIAGPAQAASVPKVSEADLRRHIDYLASDALAGRKPGTPGAGLAADYIARQFAAAGLQPGAAGGGWFQPVKLVERSSVAVRTEWSARGQSVDVPAGMLALMGARADERIERAPVVFAGYGLVPGGADVRGAVVLVLPGAPGSIPDAPTMDMRRASMFARGAAAVLVATGASGVWDEMRQGLVSGATVLEGDPVGPIAGAIEHKTWRRLVEAAGEAPDALLAAAAAPDFRERRIDLDASLSATTRIRSYDGFNVVGRLPGTRPASGSVVAIAHYDHLGVCRPGAPDPICNGAVDNASGVAMLIEVARRVAATPARRDRVFLATTAEELGLLGARSFVRQLGSARSSIAAAINFDTVAVAPRGQPVSIIGRGRVPSLDAAVDRVAKAAGRRISRDLGVNAYAARQDGWEFTKAGIPAVMAGGSFTDLKRLRSFLAGPYHQPADDPAAPIELGGAAEDSDFAVALVAQLADPRRFPAPPR